MLPELRRKVDTLLRDYEVASKQAEQEEVELERLNQNLKHLQKAQEIVQALAQRVQQTVHERIASVVTKCLQTVFDDDAYKFCIVFERKRGKTEAVLQFEREGQVIDPMTAAGGGVIDVAAFALRLSALILQTPAVRRVVILDESFRFVSAEYRPRVSALLEMLSREMKVQFVLVTHSKELMIGKVIELP